MSLTQPHAPSDQADIVARLVYAVASWDECVSLIGTADAGTAEVLDQAEPELRLGGIKCIRVGGWRPARLAGRDLMAQVLGLSNPDALTDDDLRAGFAALTEPGDGCSRVALLVAGAHALLPSATRTIQFACRTSPKLLVVLAGQPGLSALLAEDEFSYLRQRITRKLELPDPATDSLAVPAAVASVPESLLPSVVSRWGGTRTLAKLGVAAALAFVVLTTRWADPAPHRVSVPAEPPTPSTPASLARAERGGHDGVPAQAGADPLVVWATPGGNLPSVPVAPAPNGRAASVPPAPEPPAPEPPAVVPAAAAPVAKEADRKIVQPEPQPTAVADVPGAASGAADATPDAMRPHEAAVTAQTTQVPVGPEPLPTAPAPMPAAVAEQIEAEVEAARKQVARTDARTDAPGQASTVDEVAPGLAASLGAVEAPRASVPDAPNPSAPIPSAPVAEAPALGGADGGPSAPASEGALELAAPVPSAPEPPPALPLPPPPGRVRTVTATAAAPEAARRPRGGTDRGATTVAASPAGPTDERRCREIVMKAQLGEDPSDADKQFLRSGCRAR